ncbi:MAG TPA: hypothetical protein VEJ87_11200, partial [Acidimicrobiales bacterium]|nr:hypothetical protein [Acidimicrobiales bacterium]
VYVPRWQSERLAQEAVSRLPNDGFAIDLCTGAGAIAVVLMRRRPLARILATELDPVAEICARRNGVEVYRGDMAGGLPAFCNGKADVVTAIVPYVPTADLHLLPRDVLAKEPVHALDGGKDGTDFLCRAIVDAASLLRNGGSLLLELGGDQAQVLEPVLFANGYREVELSLDDDGELRALFAIR